jgi:hypothetical protein
MPRRAPRAKTRNSKRGARRATRSNRRNSRGRWQFFRRLWPSAKTRERVWRLFVRLPLTLQTVTVCAAIVALWFAINGVYQVILKPTELFFPVSGALNKGPQATWRSYARIFRKHSTATITPEFLAALAQTEASGNPIARTYWRWKFSTDPFKVYRPASSAVGMYQITDGTFREARRYCIHDHVVAEDGPWNDFQSCWFNGLYMRVIPSHAVEMTSAYLDRHVARALARARIANATARQKQDLAAIIHLCGAGAGMRHAQRGLQIAPGQRCGDHDVLRYVTKVERMRQTFVDLARR